jgi:hypothetical protein
MSARANTVAQGFSNKIMRAVYDRNILDNIVNRNYQGEINQVGSQLNILDFDKVTEKTYANAAMTYDALTENNGKLTIDQYRAFYWAEKDLANWLSYIKDPHPAIVEQVANERSKNMDAFALGFYGDVGAGNRVGTDETTGTVSIAALTGVVTGSNTAFTEAMEGRGFKAVGHSKWYRVLEYTSATSITIEDDEDDVISHYSGGLISGATYIIEAATVLSITTTNILQYVGQLKLKLDKAEDNGYNAVPTEGRFLIVPPEFEDTITRATGVALHVPDVYTELVKQGYLGQIKGFNVYVSNRLTGDNTDGWRILAGHPNWLTFAEKVLSARMEEDLPGDFGTAYKDLFVYGGKVKDAQRHQAAEAFWKFA